MLIKRGIIFIEAERRTTTTMAPQRSRIAVVASFLSGAAAINNGLAITPPMGWVQPPHFIIIIATTDRRKEQLERFRMRCLREPAPYYLVRNSEPRSPRPWLQLCCAGRLLARSQGTRQAWKTSDQLRQVSKWPQCHFRSPSQPEPQIWHV